MPRSPRIENLTNAGKGRKPGVPNKATVEVRELARRLVEDAAYRESLARRLRAGKAPHMETLLFHYAYGKPKDTVEVTGNEGGPIAFTINLAYAANTDV